MNAKEFVVSVDDVGKGEQGRGVPKEFTKFKERLRESRGVRGARDSVFSSLGGRLRGEMAAVVNACPNLGTHVRDKFPF